MTVEAIKERLEHVSTIVKNNVQIETRDDVGSDYLLHIAITRFSAMTPTISRRGANSEDNTLPRVHVAPTLLGCIDGYSGTGYDVQNMIANESKVPVGQKTLVYKGGYYIHAIPFDFCLKPSKKLVYDAVQTGERWLITYDKNTISYPTSVVGKLIPILYKLEPVEKHHPDETIDFAMEITQGPVMLSSEIVLEKGCYKLAICNQSSVLLCEPMSKGDYQKHKQQRASLLSLESSYYKW